MKRTIKSWHMAVVLIALAPLAMAQTNHPSANVLQQENASLRAELAQVRASCTAAGNAGPAVAGEQRVGDLAFSVVSLRTGASDFMSGGSAVTLTVRIHNNGSQPVSLDYNQRTFGLVDDHGYEYKLYDENTPSFIGKDVKGIPMATESAVSVSNVLQPGQDQNVTFIALRFMRNGETVGSRFDLNVTFGQYADLGQGRAKHVRDYPFAAIGVARL
jgi:hypothetical protein